MAGLVGTLNFASGTGAIDPQTRTRVPDQRELNLKIEYRPSWLASTALRGLVFTMRSAFYDQEASHRLARQIHVILDWEWDTPCSQRSRDRK